MLECCGNRFRVILEPTMCPNAGSQKWGFPPKWAVFLHLNVFFGRKILYFSICTLRNRDLHQILRRNSCYCIFLVTLFHFFTAHLHHSKPHKRVGRPRIAIWHWPPFLPPCSVACHPDGSGYVRELNYTLRGLATRDHDLVLAHNLPAISPSDLALRSWRH